MKTIKEIVSNKNISDIQLWLWSLLRTLLIAGMGFIILYPLLVKLSTSFMEIEDFYDSTVAWIPRRFTLENYRVVFEYMKYPQALTNSVILSSVVSLLQLVACTLVGYGFARFEFFGKKFFFAAVIFTLIVPPQLMLIPLYINFRFFNLFGLIPGDGINLLGSYWPFLLLAITGTGIKNGLFIFIMRQFFKGMPKSLEESAYVDGAGPYKTFFLVMVPSAVPAMLVVFLFSFVWQYNDIFFKTVFLQQNAVLMAMTFQSVVGEYVRDYEEMYNVKLPMQINTLLNNTAALFYIGPLLILFALLQRYFIESIERTGIVG